MKSSGMSVRPDRDLRPQRVGQRVPRCGVEGELGSLESRL